MKHVVAWVAWWVVLFWLWILLVGKWNREQVLAAAIAAALAGAAGEFARSCTEFSAPLPIRVLAEVPQALGMVVVDFGILTWALLASVARRRIVRGELVERELPPERAWTILISAFSPNAFVVDTDSEKRTALLHDLVPYRNSEKPV